MKITTYEDFIEKIHSTIKPRRLLTTACLNHQQLSQPHINSLANTLSEIQQIPAVGNHRILPSANGESIKFSIDYEQEELKKDLYFFHQGQEAFMEKYQTQKDQKEIRDGVQFLQRYSDQKITSFITDRDGTINNYCTRYNTSVQSAYNAVLLTEFAATRKNALILTSAPLSNIGLRELSVAPEHHFILAGSKGREYMFNDMMGHQALSDNEKLIMEQLNQDLNQLVKRKKYRIFTRIGSGLQYKFGQTTIARQDIHYSIDQKKSDSFLKEVQKIVSQYNQEKTSLIIEDTGLDIEIILTTPATEKGPTKDYDKGNGLAFLHQALQLDLSHDITLICGDTFSDLPMLDYSVSVNKNTLAIFVTESKKLQEEVRKITSRCYFVTKPDNLIFLLNKTKSLP
ncbi:MAG: hypothetical protein R6T91_08735 [Bacteroidales bacterium]